MRARLVLENINFERGGDPKRSMRIGNPIAQAKAGMKRVFEELVKEYGKECKYRIVNDRSWEAIKGYFYYDPSNEKWWYPPIIFIIVYFPDADMLMVYPAKRWHLAKRDRKDRYSPEIKIEIKSVEEAKEKIKKWISQNPIDSFDINESINFERGQDPKDAMELGDVRGRKLKSIAEILIKEFQKIFENKKYFKPKFEIQYKGANEGFGNRDQLETDIINVSLKYKGYSFELEWLGNPLNTEVVQKFMAKWFKLPRGAADGETYRVLNQAIYQLDQWIKNA